MIELHGNINNFYCTNCKKKFNSKYYQKSHKCNNGHDNFEKKYTKCNGTLRPNIVLSGEIPKYLELALFNMYKSDIVLIIGTEMSISPINKLPVMAREKGAKLVAINKEPIELEISNLSQLREILQKDENVKPIKTLKHGRKAKSLVKYGLEEISNVLFRPIYVPKFDVFKFLSCT